MWPAAWGRCLQRQGAAVRCRIGEAYDKLRCVFGHRLTRAEAAPLQRRRGDFGLGYAAPGAMRANAHI